MPDGNSPEVRQIDFCFHGKKFVNFTLRSKASFEGVDIHCLDSVGNLVLGGFHLKFMIFGIIVSMDLTFLILFGSVEIILI